MKKSISIGNFNYLSRLYRTFSGKMIHKLTYCFFVVLLLFLLSAQTIFAQQKEWTIKEPFEKRFFIENLGQFNEHEPDKKTKILFGSHTKGINIYFTDRGFIIQYSKKVKRTHRELEELEGGEEKNKKSEAERRREEEMLRYKDVPVYEEMVWETVNDKHGVLSFDKIETKHCYPYNDFKSTYQAEAWKKIRYVEIYPGIDVEFYFPGDSAGFKYNYIVKPGADTRLIKENWNSKSAKELSVNGDLGIKAVFGDVVVKKPVIITSEKKPGPEVKFKLDRKTVSYEISSTVSTDFIIDPWVITPVFASTGDPYDIDVDIAGNVYIYGGIAPFSLNKYNASGTLLWTYYLSSFTSLYGDFAVDYNTGSVYIVNGFGAPVYPSVHKLSTTGALVATYPYSTDMNEMWRIVFSSCTNQAVIGGGGVSGLNQISYLDTSLTSITSVNAYSTTFSYIDIALLAVDNFGSCYFLHAKSTLGGAGASPFANNICKAPIPSFLPMTYAVPTSYSFYEVIGLSYNYGNGVNGMAIGDKTLYSYDSYVLNKYNATSGALLLSKTMHVPTSSASSMNWTGISVDECQNLFVASKDTIVQFDSLFNEINRYPMSGNVTDIKLKNGIVYSCGIGFVSVMVPSGLVYCTPSINPNFTSVNATCNVQGSATVNPSGGTAPYTVYWNTIPIQYGLTATDLAPGTYTVYISDSTCSGNFTSYEFSIGADSDAIAPVYTVQDVSCYGLTNGSINITPTGGTAPYSYYLDSVLVSGGSPISGLNAGTYLVTIIDSNNCYSEFSVKVKPPGPDINVSYTVEMFGCGGDSVNLTAVYSGGIAPYTLAWNTSPVLTTETVYGLSPNALYSLTVTDGAGCSKTYTDSIEAPDSMYITMNLYEPLCDSLDTGALTGIATGGVYVHDYAWSHDPFIGFGIATGLGPGIYTLTVTDAIGCVVSATDTLTYEGFSTNVNLQNVSCNGFNNGAIELINSGGTPAYAYTWDTLSGLSGNIVTGLAAGTYGVTISDAGSAGCTTHLDLVISEPLPISALILPESVNCFGDLATLFCTASGGTAQYNVVWNTPTPVFNDTLYNAAPGIYSVTVTDSSGCSFSLTDTLTEPLPLTLLLNVDSVGCFGSTPGSITAIVNGGTVPYSYEWSNDTTLNSNVNGGLSTGIYFIEVTDEHGCTVTAFDTVFGLDFPSISFTDSIACNGGSFGKLEVHPLGGSAGIVFSYVWNSSPVQYGLVASDLAAGTYTLTIQGGECVQNHTVVLGELPMRDSLAFDGVLCNGSPEVELFLPQNVNPGYQWYLNGISQPGQTTLSYEVLAGNVPITSATWFANGCRFVTTQAQITEYAIPSTTAIPNIFTPNDDALNRYFYPFVFTRATDQALINEQFQTFHMQIFNRWGQLMYESTNPNEGWNGNDIEGVPVSAGVYFVVMKYEALCSGVDGENIYQGTVQLVR